MSRSAVLSAAVVFILAAGANSLKAMPLVCDDPAHVVAPSSDLYKMHRLFNATESSQRVFSEIHFHEPRDPHLTVGMGHWTYAKLARLFRKLRSDRDVWDQVARVWVPLLDDRHWEQLSAESGAEGRDAAALGTAVDKLLCAAHPAQACINGSLKPWAARIGEDFNTDAHWLSAGWRVVGRLPAVAEIQLAHWVETVLQDGVKAAKERGITARGGIASVMSAESSGIGATMFKAGASSARAGSGTLARSWSLSMVPAAARTAAPEVQEADLLQDWRAVVAWQFYTVKKEKVRSRMAEIWRVFYVPSWGSLARPPRAATATAIPKHTGCYMRQDAFDFALRLSDDPHNCSKPLPAVSPEPCAE